MFDNQRSLPSLLLRGFFCFGLFFTATVHIEAQRKYTVRPAVKPAAEKADSVKIRVVINADKTLLLTTVTGYEREGLDGPALQKAIREYLQQQTKGRRPPAYASVIITPDRSLDAGTLLGVVRSLRITRETEVKVEIPDGPTLRVAPDPKFEKPEKVRPNPLFLLAELDREGKLGLNNEPQGGLSDLTPLIDRLKEIFKAREINGVFRENTSEIETAVWIKIHPGSTIGDLQKIANAVELAGSDRIGLHLDESVYRIIGN